MASFLIVVLIVLIITLFYAILNNYENRRPLFYPLQKIKLSKEQIKTSKEFPELLPKGYSIVFNVITKKYSCCDETGYRSVGSYLKKEDAIDHAWKMYQSNIERSEKNWIKVL